MIVPRVLPLAIKWIERRIPEHSLVDTSPFISDEYFPWAVRLQANWRIVRQELDKLLAYRDDLPNFQDISGDQARLSTDDHWKTFFFHAYGYRFAGNCARCPETAALLEQIPGLKTAFYSILGPQKHLPPHRGPYKGVIRYHLALRIPDPETACGIRVGGEERHWHEGAGLFFDDTYLHEAWNDTDEDRVVLFLDVVRPLRFPYSVVNNIVIKGIGKSRFVQDARGNHDAWERRFEQLHSSR